MCGIAGVYHFGTSKETDEKTIAAMRDTLIHRGPDDAGIYLSPNKKVGFGTRRLKIIDLSQAGHMPMTDTTRTAWITYNGEIYNFKELRRELGEKGYKFNSRSDTEVILNAYLEYGADCVKRFNGMFAFVIWDERKQLLFAARDHIGIKPLYYSVQDGTFYFGSEIKAILAHPDFKKELNEESISYYLTFASTPAPNTLFKNIKKLPPATSLVIQNGKIKEQEYWNPAQAHEQQNLSEQSYVERARELLKDSIRGQMVSDVPFGCFLSGGIDSSTNAALMSEALGKPVETFSIGSEKFQKYNEFKYSRMMAKRLGARSHEFLMNDSHLDEFLSKFGFFADDPNSDQVSVPLFFLSKFTRENGVIVIQIGEGSDEIFAGYPVYLETTRLYNRWWRMFEKLPGSAKNFGFKAFAKLAHPKLEFAQEYARRLSANQEPFWGYATPFSDFQKEKLMTEQFKKMAPISSSYGIVEKIYSEIKNFDTSADFLKRLTYLEIRNRLPEVLLMRADKMTMAHSVEGRVPFLDSRLVELALQITTNIKLKNWTLKYVLKKAVEGIIPDEIISRKKQGFAAPMSEWFRPETKTADRMVGIIRNSKIKERGLFNYDYIEKIIRAHQFENVENNFRLWNLVTLSLWYDYWFK